MERPGRTAKLVAGVNEIFFRLHNALLIRRPGEELYTSAAGAPGGLAEPGPENGDPGMLSAGTTALRVICHQTDPICLP